MLGAVQIQTYYDSKNSVPTSLCVDESSGASSLAWTSQARPVDLQEKRAIGKYYIRGLLATFGAWKRRAKADKVLLETSVCLDGGEEDEVDCIGAGCEMQRQ